MPGTEQTTETSDPSRIAEASRAADKAASVSRKLLVSGDGGGRETQPTNFNPFGGMPYAFVPRRMLYGLDLSTKRVSDFAPWLLMQILADSHTDVGLALWNVLRLGIKGFDYTVKTLKGEDDPEGKAMLDALVPRLNKKSGGLKALHIQSMLSWYLYGAVCGEMALTEDLRDVLDIYPVNPFTILFRRDAVTQDLVIYQQQFFNPEVARKAAAKAKATAGGTDNEKIDNQQTAAGFRRLNDNLVFYTPCDPTIDDPYGRIPSATVINEVFFDIKFLADLQKIVHGVGTPKYVIKIVEEILAKSCPPAIKQDPAKYAAWLDKRLIEVQAAFNGVPVDAAFVQFDSVVIDIVSAKSGTNILGLVTPLSRAIERRIIKALKMLPILMASNESTTETHGSVQFEIFAEGIGSAQDAICQMDAQMFQTYLQLMGRQCLVTCEFAAIKTANRLLVANALNKEIINSALKEMLGYQTHDESASEITGNTAVGPALPGVLQALVPPLTSPSAEAPASARSIPEDELETLLTRFWNEKQQKEDEDDLEVLT